MSMSKGGKPRDGRYDFLIVGAGLYGAVMARELSDRGFRVLVIEKKRHIGGCAYTELRDGIIVHKYGPHIFHTDSEEVWHYVNRFAKFNGFVNRPAAVYKGEQYTLPVCMDTFEQLWGVTDPTEAKRMIRSQAETARASGRPGSGDPKAYLEAGAEEQDDLEAQAASMFGTDIYERLIKGYSEKQWGRPCSELPPSHVRRMRISFDRGCSYYDDRYQGVPVGGYTPMIERLLEGIELLTGADYDEAETRERLGRIADRVIYSGSIDAYYGYRLGRLGFRSVRFEEERLCSVKHFQDRAVVNYTGIEVPFTRITEHKYFMEDPAAMERNVTIITREYPTVCEEGSEPFYPVADETNIKLYGKYRKLAETEGRVFFGGRLGSYRYMDMDEVIASALRDAAVLAGADRDSMIRR